MLTCQTHDICFRVEWRFLLFYCSSWYCVRWFFARLFRLRCCAITHHNSFKMRLGHVNVNNQYIYIIYNAQMPSGVGWGIMMIHLCKKCGCSHDIATVRPRNYSQGFTLVLSLQPQLRCATYVAILASDFTQWGVQLSRDVLFCFILEVSVTNRAAQCLQHQPNGRWNMSKILTTEWTPHDVSFNWQSLDK